MNIKNNISKKWAPQMNFKSASDLVIDWCIRARDKNILIKKQPTIYYSYIVEDSVQIQHLNNVSSLFKYSTKDLPYINESRDSILRCLSIALKTHFLYFSNENVEYEPYFFTFPSLNEPKKSIYGIIYKIHKEEKTIIVCEKNLSIIFDKNKILHESASILLDDSFKWYSTKNWYKIKNEINFQEKPWNIKSNVIYLAQQAKTIEELKKYAHILDVPYEIKDYAKPIGLEWSKINKTWYLPFGLGMDIDSIQEYIFYLKKVNKLE